MKKLRRLIEIKRQFGLLATKMERVTVKWKKLDAEKNKILASFTMEEKRLYKERIERACR